MTYTMSTDYDALYDLLCGGGEALGRYGHLPVRLYRHIDRLFITNRSEPYEVFDIGIGKAAFKSTCTRLSLEWLAPVDIAEVIKAGDYQYEALLKAEQDLRDWKRLAIALRGESEEGLQRGIKGCMPHRAGIEHTSQIADACYQAKNAWTDATAKHRTT